MILLDTNAVIWLGANHRRARPLTRKPARLFVSPATVLEIQMLSELGRLRLHGDWMHGDAWRIDNVPATDWFAAAAEESWTRDPFDRLIVAHARVRRWRLATADGRVLERLLPSERIEL